MQSLNSFCRFLGLLKGSFNTFLLSNTFGGQKKLHKRNFISFVSCGKRRMESWSDFQFYLTVELSCKQSFFSFQIWTKKIRLYFFKKSTALAQKCFARVAAMWHYQQDKRFLHGNFQKGACTMVQKSLWIRNLSTVSAPF